MAPDRPGRIIETHRFAAHVAVPASVSLLLMGLYFSGSEWLQAVVAPTVEGLHPFSWREFGALEMLQNLVLLVTVALYVAAIGAAPSWPWRAMFAAAAAGFVFVFLEEIDYGAHFIEWWRGELGSLVAAGWDRNLHNRVTSGGVQYGSYMRLVATAVLLAGFVLAPLLLQQCRIRWVRVLVPSRWMIATVLLMAVLSRLAHALDDAGLGTIDGVAGNLDHNISEFRELNLYWLFALYAAELIARLNCAGARQ